MFRVEDEGDGRNDARVAHARPIVVENHGSWPCGQMLPRRRDRAGTRTWRSMGVTPPICPTCRSLEAVLAAVADSGKIRAAKWATLPPTPRPRARTGSRSRTPGLTPGPASAVRARSSRLRPRAHVFVYNLQVPVKPRGALGRSIYFYTHVCARLNLPPGARGPPAARACHHEPGMRIRQVTRGTSLFSGVVSGVAPARCDFAPGAHPLAPLPRTF